jgi:N-acetylglutamate synthase-like GNAT family acetyltransferase
LAENNLWSMVKGVVHPRRILLVAKDRGRIIGYVIGSVPAGGHGQIYWLFVGPDYRGQNVGLALLSRILKVMQAKGAKRATLITHDHAPYYARQGFKLIEKVQDGKATKYVLSYHLEP